MNLGRLFLVLALVIGCKKDAEKAEPTEKETEETEKETEPAEGKKLSPKPLEKKSAQPSAAARGRNVELAPDDVPVVPEQEDRGKFVLSYAGDDSETRALVRTSGLFEKMLPQLDESLNLPGDVEVVFDECDEVNAFYDPETARITMCDEYVDYYGELFSGYPDDEARALILGSVVSTFLHELGHALIDQLELPAVGKEEDAVDQLSMVILLASGDEGNEYAIDGAYAFIAELEGGEEDTTPFWDSHSLNEQRFYNTVCLVYGSDPEGWADLVGDDDLPQERADGCADEYEFVSTSWNRLLEPYMTVPAMRVKLER